MHRGHTRPDTKANPLLHPARVTSAHVEPGNDGSAPDISVRAALDDLSDGVRVNFGTSPHYEDVALVLVHTQGAEKIALEFRKASGEVAARAELTVADFDQAIRDYIRICERHRAAIDKNERYLMIEALDHSRRDLHNAGADLLLEKLAANRPEITCEHEVGRRLFTLMTAVLSKT